MNQKPKKQIDIKPLCERVVVNDQGLALAPSLAFYQRGICAKIILVRKDGWTLGAPAEFEQVAYSQWPEHWTGFMRWPLYEKQPISAYKPVKSKKGR